MKRRRRRKSKRNRVITTDLVPARCYKPDHAKAPALQSCHDLQRDIVTAAEPRSEEKEEQDSKVEESKQEKVEDTREEESNEEAVGDDVEVPVADDANVMKKAEDAINQARAVEVEETQPSSRVVGAALYGRRKRRSRCHILRGGDNPPSRSTGAKETQRLGGVSANAGPLCASVPTRNRTGTSKKKDSEELHTPFIIAEPIRVVTKFQNSTIPKQ